MPIVRRRQQPGDSLGFLFVFLFLFVTVTFVLFLFVAAARHEDRYRKHQEEVKTATVSESAFGKTIMYEGHRWIIWDRSDDIDHHPDCPCRKNQSEKD